MADRTRTSRPRPVKDAGPAKATATARSDYRDAEAPGQLEQTLDAPEVLAARYEREARRLRERLQELQATDALRRQALGCAIQAAAGRRIRWGKLAVRITQAAAEFERYLAAGR